MPDRDPKLDRRDNPLDCCHAESVSCVDGPQVLASCYGLSGAADRTVSAVASSIMLNLQHHLLERFGGLRDSRRGSVFFVEHGLGADKLDELRGCVRANLQSHPLESGWWEQHDLPLLVAATEVGYRYRGTGTDFWPLLEDDLRIELPVPNRQRIRDLFVRASEKFRGVRPPNTAWAQAFHLIAWPIAHALLPVEFHRSLAMTLANLRARVSEADDDALYRAVRTAAAFPTARFATLLEDAAVVISLTRCLLGQRTDELSEEIIERVSIDLEADDVARRGVAVARSIQRASRSTGGVLPISTVSEIRGSFQLRRASGGMMLEAAFPALEPGTASRLRGALRRRRFAPRLWGVTARVTSDQLLSGFPFVLKLMELPGHDTPVFPDLEHEGLDPQDLALLHSFQLQFQLPQLFAVSTDGEVARQVRGNNVTGHRRYWLLHREDAGFRDLCIIGEVGPLRCLEIDPKSDVGARTLVQLGYKVQFGVSVRFAGTPSISREDAIPTFVAGEHCVLVPQRLSDEATLKIDVNGSHSLARASELVRVIVREGDQLVQVSNDTDFREYPFRGIESVQPPSAAVRVTLRSEERTLQALLAGRLSFMIESFAPLGGVQLTVDLEAAGKQFSATGALEPLPQMISAEHPILEQLLAEDVRDIVSSVESVILRARVGHLAAASWELERTVRPCWWDLRTGPTLLSEVGPLRFGVVSADDPLRAPMDRPPGDGANLLAPIGLDTAEFGAATPFTTLCLAPDRAQLALPSISKPRLARRRRGAGTSVGLEDLAEAYLRWSLAETRSAVGDLRRGQVTMLLDGWVTELCCGTEWARIEETLPTRNSWALLEQVCCELGLGHDSYVALTVEQTANVRRLAIDEIRRSMPCLWSRVGPPSELGADDYEALDLAFASAYVALSATYRARGNEELADQLGEADPGDDPALWDQALRRVHEAIELRELAALLLPSSSVQRLMKVDVGGLTVDEVADELSDWSRSSRRAFAGAPPTRDTLRAIYALWVEPELALTADWRGALDTLLAERAVARATRYLAVKARDARRGDV